VQWSRDSFVIDGLSTSILDPSLPYGQKTGSKMAIDATLPRGSGRGPRPIVPRATVPDTAASAAAQLVEAGANSHWPRF